MIEIIMEFISSLYRGIYKRLSSIVWKSRFESFGDNSFIYKPLHIKGTNIHIGDNVFINRGVWLASDPLACNGKALLKIGDGSVIGHFNEIYSTGSIIIENHVLTADRVYISDNIHGYGNIEVPILQQPIVQKKEVRIGEGTWLGVGVSVIGASIGKHCVIGSNAVVTKDIPDYCVAGGIPAKVIKRFNFATQQFENENIKQIAGGGKRFLLSYCPCAA